jgi:hypothetical protein
VTSNVYKAGGRASALYAALGAPDCPGQAELAARYIAELKQQSAVLLGGTTAARLVPLEYNGDLNWYWTDGISFNALTYNYISGAINPSGDASGLYHVGGAGSFGNLYQELINAIAWQFGAADNAAMQQAATQSQTQASAIVQAYMSVYGAPTAAQMQEAQAYNDLITQPIDYILMYLAAYLWAGKPAPPLTRTTMQNAANLGTLLQYAPPSATPVIQAIPPYLQTLGASARLMDMQTLAGFTLSQIKRNLLAPSATNGGTQLFNPPSPNYYAGYFSNLTPSQILQAFASGSPQVTISISATVSPSGSYTISFAGEPSFDWCGDLFNISAGSFRGDVARQAGAGSAMTLTMVYPGVSIMPLFPKAWQQISGGSTGWWYEAIVDQAWSNYQLGPGAPSGFTFLTGVPVGIELGPDGLGYLSAVVAGDPTITIAFTNGDYAAFSSWLSTHTTVSVSLFGFMPLGSASSDPYTARVSPAAPGFTLTLTPPLPGSRGQIVPAASQTVPVLAGQVSWLGAGS